MIGFIRRHFAHLLYGQQETLPNSLLTPYLVRLILLANAGLMAFFLVAGLAGLFPLGRLHAWVLVGLILIQLISAFASWLRAERSGTLLLTNLILYALALVPIILSDPELMPALFTALLSVMAAFLLLRLPAGLLTAAVAALLPALLTALDGALISALFDLIYELTLVATVLISATLGLFIRSLLERLHAALERLRHSATHDPLTGALNRRGLQEHGEVLFNTHYRTVSPLALAVVDLDFFKPINDTYGHDAGDHALKHVTELMRHHFKRKSDLVARLGGDEFVLIAANTPLETAYPRLVEMARHLQADRPRWQGKPLPLALSLGVATLDPEQHHTLEDLLKAADEQVYRAKAQGRSHVCSPPECTAIPLAFEPPASQR